jgi:hypothetical protein
MVYFIKVIKIFILLYISDVLYQNNPAGCFVAGPLVAGPFVAGPFAVGPFVAGRFVGAAIHEYFLEIVECKFARNGLTN